MTTGHTMKEPPFLTVVYGEGDVCRYEGRKHTGEPVQLGVLNTWMLDDSHHTMVLIVFEREYEQTAMLLQQRSGDPIIVGADLGLVSVWRRFN